MPEVMKSLKGKADGKIVRSIVETYSEQKLTILDFIILIVVLIGFILGFKDGFVRKIIGFVGFVTGNYSGCNVL